MRMPTVDRKDARDIFVIIAAWCGSALIVNPIGDFPLGDDWSYGRTVAHLLETGHYEPTNWNSAMLVTNVLWGALFCFPAGFSFTALRFSTLVAALLGLIGVYVLFRDLRQPRRVALLVALVLGFNPIYYVLSHTFMTDVLFTALLTWGGICFARTLRTGSNQQLIAGTALALAAMLSRQIALCLPVAFAATTLLQSRTTVRVVIRALIPAFVCAAAYLAFSPFAAMGNSYEKIIFETLLSDVQLFISVIIRNIYFILIHIGLFLLPILLLAARGLWQFGVNRVIAAGAIATLIVVVIAMARIQNADRQYGDEFLLPFFDNWLVKSGLGMLNLRDVYILKLDNLPPLPAGFWVTVTGLGLAGAVLLTTIIFLHAWELISIHRSGKPLDANAMVGRFALLTSALYFLLCLPLPAIWDKYVIPIIPFLVVTIVCFGGQQAWFSSDSPRALRLTVYAMLVTFSLFSIAGTRDFLTWNRVRWTALRELMQVSYVGPEDIDGGFEFNGLYLYTPIINFAATDISWWWVRRDTYQIGFGPVPGYKVFKEYTYQHWLPWHVQKIVVLHKE